MNRKSCERRNNAVEEVVLWSNVVIVDELSSPHLPSEDYFRKLTERCNGSNNKEIVFKITSIPKFGQYHHNSIRKQEKNGILEFS